jgi:hypothetical protein
MRQSGMAAEPKRPAKSEVLSMRMDPKTRFLVDVLAKHRGQSISTVVERAILEAADNAVIGDPNEHKTWRDYWHISEGVRALQIAADKNLYPTYEEECLIIFARIHWPFFYTSSDCKIIKAWNVDIIWPRIDYFLDVWEETKSSNYFATGRLMQRALSDAGLAAPEWPIKAAEKAAPAPKAPPSKGGDGPSWDEPKGGDLDDEIPF